LKRTDGPFDYYGTTYGQFDAELQAEIRRAAFGEDIGQNSWLTADEQDALLGWISLTASSTLLDVACGGGGPTLRIVDRTGCRVVGVDLSDEAVATARRSASSRGLAERSRFETADAGGRLAFEDGTFDAIVCIDAVNHLPDRPAVLREWRRVLRPGGDLVFTDPTVVTGPLTNEEIAVRSSIGFFLFVPRGTDEALLDAAGFVVLRSADRTENMALLARRRHDARAARADELRRVEGDAAYDSAQRFYAVAARLAAERRLSRLAFHARRV
jgi:SAM-dependent methyltransferase